MTTKPTSRRAGVVVLLLVDVDADDALLFCGEIDAFAALFDADDDGDEIQLRSEKRRVAA
jgi:hypothetical protein